MIWTCVARIALGPASAPRRTVGNHRWSISIGGAMGKVDITNWLNSMEPELHIVDTPVHQIGDL